MEKKKIILIGLCVLFVAIFGILLFFILFQQERIITGKTLTYKNYVVLEGHTGELKSYDKSLYVEGYKGNYDDAYYISGTLKSNELEKQRFVVVRFNLYDKKNNILGEAIAGIENVEKGIEYNFKAMSLTTTEDTQKVYKYDLKSIESK